MKNVSVTIENYKIGDKVVRGKDWCFANQDKDSEYGEIIYEHNNDGWVSVRWQSGYTNDYCINENTDLHLYFYKGDLTNSLINRIGHLLI